MTRYVLMGVGAAVALVAAAPRGRTLTGAPASTSSSALSEDVRAAPFRCPSGGRTLAPGTALQAVLDSASPGAVLCLSPGTYTGGLEVHTRLALIGPPNAVVRSTGIGTTLRVLAESAAVRGFTIDGSGRRYDKMDGALYVHGDGIEARDLSIRNALFGIVAEQSNGVTIANNRVYGLADLPIGIRGDGIRLWEVRRSRVADNTLEHSRDIVVWYSPGNVIAGNTVTGSRYATHFMYSDDCLVADGDYRDNIVGVFVMYSRGITLAGNTIADNAVADGMGLGVKESGNLIVKDNTFLHDRDCLYLDTSPFRAGDSVLVRGNTFARCNAGVTFHSSEHRNAFRSNVFEQNHTHVAVEGRGTARHVLWRRNYFDDYQGYDLNGDGLGDVPYELRNLSERLVMRHPQLAFFRGTVTFALLDVAARVFPLLEPETLLVDPEPRTAPPRAVQDTGEVPNAR